MIKVYLDWNVMSGIKTGLYLELQKILSDNEKFYLPYSTAHISDIHNSESEEIKDIINDDLNFISSLTSNNCIFTFSNNFSLDYRLPHDIYKSKISFKNLI